MTETAESKRFSQLFIDDAGRREELDGLLIRVETSLFELDSLDDATAAWFISEALKIAAREKLEQLFPSLVLMNGQLPLRYILDQMQ